MDKGQKFITADLIHLQICRFQNGKIAVSKATICGLQCRRVFNGNIAVYKRQLWRLPSGEFAVFNLRLWIHHGDPYLLPSPYLVTYRAHALCLGALRFT